MILAKELKWLVGRWIASMNESADALLPRAIAVPITSAVINSMLKRTAAIASLRRPFWRRIDICFSRLG